MGVTAGGGRGGGVPIGGGAPTGGCTLAGGGAVGSGCGGGWASAAVEERVAPSSSPRVIHCVFPAFMGTCCAISGPRGLSSEILALPARANTDRGRGSEPR